MVRRWQGLGVWSTVAAVGAVALAACGGGDEVASDVTVVDDEGLAGIEVSIATAATFARGEQGVVLVDGLAGTADERTTRVYLHDGAGRREVAAPDLPLNAVEAWFAEERLIIAGIDCPRFDRDAVLADSGGGDVEGICGAMTRRRIAVDLETEEWELLEEQPVESLEDPRLPAAADGRVLLGPGRLWDPQEGRVALSGLPDVGLEREVTICSAGGVPRAVVRTGGDLSPSALPHPPPGAAPRPVPPAPLEREPEVMRLYELVGTEWREDPIDIAQGFAGQAPLGCSTNGMVVGGYDDRAGEVVARVVTSGAQGEIVLAPLDLPTPEGSRVPWVSVDVAGTILIESGNGHWTAIDGGRRIDLGAVDLMSARQVLVHGDLGLVIPNVLDRAVAIEEA